MRRMIVVSTAAVFLSVITSSGGARRASLAQVSAPQQTTQQGSHPTALDGDVGPADVFKERIEAQAARSRTNERHKRIVSDTEKLLELSTELKADVDKTTKDELSVQVIQKAAEIEKLAHEVKERMKGQ